MRDHFTLEQLRVFKTVAASGSFSAAARKLGKAQSAISLQIQNLETDLNLDLFDRSGRYPTLTPEGNELLNEAEFILQRTERFSDLANAIQGNTLTHLVIAADELILNTQFDQHLKNLSDSFPELSVEVKFPVLDKVVAMVREKTAHIGITVRLLESINDLCVAQYSPSRMRIVCSPDHALTDIETVTESTLSQHRQILVSNFRHPDPYLQTSPSCWKAENIWGAKEMCKAAIGWALLPDYAVKQNLSDGTLVALDSPNNNLQLTLSGDIVWPRKLDNDPVINWLVSVLKQSFNK